MVPGREEASFSAGYTCCAGSENGGNDTVRQTSQAMGIDILHIEGNKSYSFPGETPWAFHWDPQHDVGDIWRVSTRVLESGSRRFYHFKEQKSIGFTEAQRCCVRDLHSRVRSCRRKGEHLDV